MTPPPQLSERLHVSSEELAAFCRRWHIAKLEVFGSVVREDFRDESDIDFLVSFEPGVEPAGFDWLQLKEELSDLVGRKVDVVDRRLVERSRNLYRRQLILSEATPVLQISARPTLKELLLAETPRAEIPVRPRRRP